MPRDGSGIYTKPFPDVVEGTTIESTVHNGTVADVETDLNAARPIVAGGTGATTAAAARTALGTEVAGAQVTNYDSHVFENGSFWSVPGATGAPVAGYAAGTATRVTGSPTDVIIELREHSTGALFHRERTTAGGWGAWKSDQTDYVNVTGDTMTGDLAINKNVGSNVGPILQLYNNGSGINGAAAIDMYDGSLRGRLKFSIDRGPFGADLIYLGGGAGTTPIFTAQCDGPVRIHGTTASSSPTTGALTIAGGVGINSALNIAGTITAGPAGGNWYNTATVVNKFLIAIEGENFRIYNASYGGNAIVLYGANSNVTFPLGVVTISNATAASSSTTGALTVSGGLGVGGSIYAPVIAITTAGADAILYINSTGGPVPYVIFQRDGNRRASIHSDTGGSFVFTSNDIGTTGQYLAWGGSTWNALSDARLPYKRAAREITDALPPLDGFHLYENEHGGGGTEMSVKAQEIHKLFPHVVRVGSDDPDYVPTGVGDQNGWGVGYDRLGAVALGYCKQLHKEIADLKRQLKEKH